MTHGWHGRIRTFHVQSRMTPTLRSTGRADLCLYFVGVGGARRLAEMSLLRMTPLFSVSAVFDPLARRHVPRSRRGFVRALAARCHFVRFDLRHAC